MPEARERRAVPRTTLGEHVPVRLQDGREVRVLDLSPRGVRITHREPLHAGGIGYVDLPPALGAVRLAGRLVWTRLRRIAHTPAGDRRPLYESGVEFTSLTPDQQTALTAALVTLQAAQTGPEREPAP